MLIFTSARRTREADGFLRGIIVANNISREEAAEFFKVGRYRYDRLRNMDPTKAIPKRPPASHSGLQSKCRKEDCNDSQEEIVRVN